MTQQPKTQPRLKPLFYIRPSSWWVERNFTVMATRKTLYFGFLSGADFAGEFLAGAAGAMASKAGPLVSYKVSQANKQLVTAKFKLRAAKIARLGPDGVLDDHPRNFTIDIESIRYAVLTGPHWFSAGKLKIVKRDGTTHKFTLESPVSVKKAAKHLSNLLGSKLQNRIEEEKLDLQENFETELDHIKSQ